MPRFRDPPYSFPFNEEEYRNLTCHEKSKATAKSPAQLYSHVCNISFTIISTSYTSPLSRAHSSPVAKFIVPDWGVKVDFGVGLLYRPTRIHTHAGGPVRQAYAIVDFIAPVRDYEFSYWTRVCYAQGGGGTATTVQGTLYTASGALTS